jgi:hypothetical protein
MPKCGKKHTPITSEKQRGLFGAELARRRAGKESRIPSITTAELESHLHESAGKDLPKKAVKKVHHSPTVTQVDCSKLRQDKQIDVIGGVPKPVKW